MPKFDFLEEGLGIVSPSYFLYGFSRTMFLMLYSISWPNFIVWLPLLLKILGNMCIAIVCFPSCDVIYLELNLAFLIKMFFFIIKIFFLRTKRAFKIKWKAFFIIFTGFPVDKNCCRPESQSLKFLHMLRKLKKCVFKHNY